jgi:hypothetical protein
LRIQVAFFERASAYSAVAWIGADDLLAIDRREAELLAEVALRAVGDQVQVAARPASARAPSPPRPARSRGPRRGARRDGQHAQQRDVADHLDRDAADQRRSVASPGITR